ncbi:hypothetical protein HAX54_027018, partial [Datura stramonium]|nr:hypothetical protein [Datura stramonium]
AVKVPSNWDSKRRDFLMQIGAVSIPIHHTLPLCFAPNSLPIISSVKISDSLMLP